MVARACHHQPSHKQRMDLGLSRHEHLRPQDAERLGPSDGQPIANRHRIHTITWCEVTCSIDKTLPVS